jgi:transcription initiation factor TFIID TATA-box-binding protein
MNAQLKTKAKIQNIVAMTTLKKPVDLEELLTQIQKRKQFHVTYEPDQFAAAIIKFLVNHDKEATILVFGSGKVVCVGLTDIEQVRSAIRAVESTLYGKNYL